MSTPGRRTRDSLQAMGKLTAVVDGEKVLTQARAVVRTPR